MRKAGGKFRIIFEYGAGWSVLPVEDALAEFGAEVGEVECAEAAGAVEFPSFREPAWSWARLGGGSIR